MTADVTKRYCHPMRVARCDSAVYVDHIAALYSRTVFEVYTVS